jgi:hypothetical protein
MFREEIGPQIGLKAQEVIREIHVGGMTLDMLQEAVRKAE